MRHCGAIEDHLFGALRTLFTLEETVTLYDLTNTYFEGEAAANSKAAHGRSKVVFWVLSYCVGFYNSVG